MNHDYENLLANVLQQGTPDTDRTGTGTIRSFSHSLRYDLRKGFPLITTKKVYFKAVVVELLWFLSGDTNVKWLQENGCTIWDEWADENGDLGPVYGRQWRYWGDQIYAAVNLVKTQPDSRRILVSAWNVHDLHKMALVPCHFAHQLVCIKGVLHLKVFIRSWDLFLGAPFNIASYALLLHMYAQQTGMVAGCLELTATDCHIYNNHVNQVMEQVSRPVRQFPEIEIQKAGSMFDYKIEDFKLVGYDPHPAIKAPVAV